MSTTVISESINGALHPVAAQLVGAASSLGGSITVICHGGTGASDAAKISGVTKVISVGLVEVSVTLGRRRTNPFLVIRYRQGVDIVNICIKGNSGCARCH